MMAGAERGGKKDGEDKMLGFGRVAGDAPNGGFLGPFRVSKWGWTCREEEERVTGRRVEEALPGTLCSP